MYSDIEEILLEAEAELDALGRVDCTTPGALSGALYRADLLDDYRAIIAAAKAEATHRVVAIKAIKAEVDAHIEAALVQIRGYDRGGAK